MPAEDVRQRKAGRKKSKKSKGKGQSFNERTSGLNGHDEVLPSPPVSTPPRPAEEKWKTMQAKVEEETSKSICAQVMFPYLLAGMGMVMAGMVLDAVQVRYCFWELLLMFKTALYSV
ncbi:solute carrier family 41 member 1 isoform X1 [Tachysurus ichikawai]